MRDKDELLQVLADYGVKSGSKMYAKGQEKLRTIVEEAISLLDEEGSKGFTMRALARQVGIPLSVLQHYFKTRDDVLIALVAFFHQTLNYEIRECFANPQEAFDTKLRRYIEDVLDYSQYAGLTHTLFSECQTISKPLAPLVEAAYQEAIDLMELHYAQARPDLEQEERLRRLTFLFASIEGISAFIANQPSMAPSPDGMSESSVAYLMKILME